MKTIDTICWTLAFVLAWRLAVAIEVDYQTAPDNPTACRSVQPDVRS